MEAYMEIVRKAAEFTGCPTQEYLGKSLREILEDLEYGGATVWWGSFSPTELETKYL